MSLNEKEEDINLAIEKIDKFKNKLEDIKQMQDLYEILEFMELVYGHIKAQENALIKNILPLEEKLKERKLDKWMERVRR